MANLPRRISPPSALISACPLRLSEELLELEEALGKGSRVLRKAASNPIQAFVQRVEALVSKGKLTGGQAAPFSARANLLLEI